MSSPIIDIRQLTKVYKNSNIKAIDQLSLQIEKGEIHGVLGPNGAGKSTTISCIVGLIRLNSGDIIIDGINIKSDIKSIKQRIGLVPQDIALYQELTAYENLMFFGRLHSISKATLKLRINDSLKQLGLYDKKNQKLKYYSGGMKRRINLIVGVLHQPKVLILDEPTVGVDVQSKQVILDFLVEINHKGTSILYTSHLMEEAEKICHRVSIIDRGQVIESGTPDALKNKYQEQNLEQVFIKLTGKQLKN